MEYLNLRKPISIMLTLACCVPGFSAVHIWSNVVPIDQLGNDEQSGAMRFEISTADPFLESSTEPIYIRIKLGSGAVLSQTLVDIESSTAGWHPIFLALFSPSVHQPQVITASHEAVSIVRCRTGENEIWLRLKGPISSWTTWEGLPSAPNSNAPVSFSLGLVENTLGTWLETLFPAGFANMPNNCLDTGAPQPPWSPQATVIRMDMTPSVVQVHDVFEVYFSAFTGTQGVSTATHPSGIQPGFQIPFLDCGVAHTGRVK